MACDRIQRPISIPEPTNEVDSLWRTTQVLKEVVEIMQGIRGNREYALKCDLDDLTSNVTNITVTGSGGGSGGLPVGQLYDLVFNSDGNDTYQATNGGLRWNTSSNSLEFINNRSISWETASAMPVELVDFNASDEFSLGNVNYVTNLLGSSVDMPNAQPMRWEDSGGTDRELINFESDRLNLGFIGYPTRVEGSYIDLRNNIGINWRTINNDPVEMLEFQGVGGTVIPPDTSYNSVVLLLQPEEADGATTTVDKSLSAHPITFNGNAQIDTGVTLFGQPTVYFDGTFGTYLSVPDSDDFWLHQSAFTPYTLEVHAQIETADYNDSLIDGACLWAHWDEPSGIAYYFAIGQNDTIGMQRSRNGSGINFYNYGGANSFNPQPGQFYHIAFCYEGQTLGGNIRCYIDGVFIGSTNHFGTGWYDSPAALTIGGRPDARAGLYYNWFKGWMGNIRWTLGIDRYGAVGSGSFTPPTGPYGESVSDVVIIDSTESFYVGDPGYATELDGTLIGLKSDIGINWDNPTGDNVELLVLTSGAQNPVTQMDYQAFSSVTHDITTSTSFVDAPNNFKIDQSTLVNGDDYYYFVFAHWYPNNGTTETAGCQLVFDDVLVTGKFSQFEGSGGSSGTSIGGNPFFACGKITANGGNPLKLQHRTGTGSATCDIAQSNGMIINANDVPNAVYGVATPATNTSSSTPGWKDGGLSVELPAGEWLVCVDGAFDNPNSGAGGYIGVGLSDGTNTYNVATNQSLSVGDISVGGYTLLDLATTTTIDVRIFGASLTLYRDCAHLEIVCLPLSDFAASYSTIDLQDSASENEVKPDTADTYKTAATVTAPSIEASNDWMVFSIGSSEWDGTSPCVALIPRYNADGAGETTAGNWGGQRHNRGRFWTITPDVGHHTGSVAGPLTFTAGQSVEFIAAVYSSSVDLASQDARNTGVLALQMGTAGTTPAFTVGDPGYRTRIDGSTVEFANATPLTFLNVGNEPIELWNFDATDTLTIGDPDYSLNIDALGTVGLSGSLSITGDLTTTGLSTLGVVDAGASTLASLLVEGDASIEGTKLLMADGAVINWNAIAGETTFIEQISGAPSGDEYWDLVTLHADFDGADAATAFTTEDPGARTVTFLGTAQLDTAVKKYGTASLLLDGNSDYCTIPHTTDLTLTDTEDFTIECWVFRDTDPGTGSTIINKGGVFGSLFPNYQLSFNGSEQATFGVYYNGGVIGVATGTTVTSFSTWYHIAGTWEAATDTVRVYLDGNLEATVVGTTNTPYSSNTNNLNIGYQPSTGSNYWPGNIDDIRITPALRYTANFDPPVAHGTPPASVTLQCNFDGADAATSYTSEDAGLRTATFNGNAQLDTAQTKFGTASLLLDGTGDYVTFPDDVAFDIGSGAFTAECWVRFNGDPGTANMTLIAQYNVTGDERAWILDLENNTLRWLWTTDGLAGTIATETAAWNPAGDTWYHVACSRDSNNNLYLFVDGVCLKSVANAVTVYAAAAPVYIGAHSAGSNPLNGWVDDVRVVIGESLYNSNFTPPTAANDTFAPGSPYWSETVLQCNFDGADAATTYTSEDTGLRSATFNSGAQLDTAQSAFGTASLLLAGTDDYVSFPDSVDFDLAAADFTIEFRVRFNGDPGTANMQFINHYLSTGDERAWMVRLVNNALTFTYSTDGTAVGTTTFSGAWNPVTAQWYHVAVCRTGTTCTAYVDGAQIFTDTIGTDSIHAPARALWIGAVDFGAGVTEELIGWIDDVQIIQGTARYIAPFTPSLVANFNGLLASGGSSFTVGDPAVPTVIDGDPVTIAGAMSLGSTLSVNGDLTFNDPTDTIAGIQNQNLLDKTAVETISGQYTFTNADGPIIESAGPELYLRETDAAVDAGNWILRANSGLLRLQTAADATPTSAATNFLAFTRSGTAISTAAIAATSVDITGALTATSYGGIIEANLVDKTATEEVTGAWTFDDTTTTFTGTGAQSAAFSYVGSDFQTVFGTTTDWDITGLTSIQAGTVDADFDAITATSYGGITEADLVDKSAAETITGAWTFSGGLTATTAAASAYFQLPTYTDTELNAIANAVNTDAGKIQGAMVYNTTQDVPVYAVGDTDGAVWVDGAGTTINTPV